MSQDNPFIRGIARRIATDPQDEAFLYDVVFDPTDNATFSVYLDWLADRRDPRAEYFQLGRDQAREDVGEPERACIQQRRDDLRTRIDSLWLGIVLREPVTGTVTRINDHGFWVDLGGLEGEVHICDCSWC